MTIECIQTIGDLRDSMRRTLVMTLKRLESAEKHYRACAVASRQACESRQSTYRVLARRTDRAYLQVRDLRDKVNAMHDRLSIIERDIAENSRFRVIS